MVKTSYTGVPDGMLRHEYQVSISEPGSGQTSYGQGSILDGD